MQLRRFLPVLLLSVITAGIIFSAHAQEVTNGGDMIFKLGASSATTVEQMRITNAGLVGVNNATPSYQLDVSGTSRLFGSYTDSQKYGAVVANYATTATNGAYSNTGLYVDTKSLVSSGITNSSGLIGLNLTAFNQSAGTTASIYGINLGVGSTTGTGTITNEYGVVISSYQASGTTTNAYGLFIQDMKATSGYGIYQTGTDDKNYFAGALGIGRAPAYQLDVSGSDIKLSTNVGVSTTSLHMRTDGATTYITNKDNFVGDGSVGNGGLYIMGQGGVYLTYGASGCCGTTGFWVNNGATNVSGTLSVTGSVTAASYFQSSDARLKENIQTSGGLAVVDKLRGVTFDWKKDNKPSAGVIAQEVEKVLPNAVATDEKGLKSVNYDQLIAPLIEAVKELHVQVERQGRQIGVLKTDNDNLRAEIRAMKRQTQ